MVAQNGDVNWVITAELPKSRTTIGDKWNGLPLAFPNHHSFLSTTMIVAKKPAYQAFQRECFCMRSMDWYWPA